MKKKLISLAMLVTVFAMQVVGVSAASKTTTMAATGAAQGKYDVEAMSQSEVADVAKVNQTAADLIKDVNAGTKTLDDIAKAESSIASDLTGESLVSAFMDVTPINGGVQLADGRYQVTLSVPALTKGMTDLLKGNKRLAQDCRRKYGENLLIYEIDSLKPYSEHLIDTISAKKIMTEKIFDRVHTYTTDGTYEVVDIFKEKFDLLHGIKIFCRAYVRK